MDRVHYAVRPPGGPFDLPEPLSADGIPSGMQIAVDSAGNARGGLGPVDRTARARWRPAPVRPEATSGRCRRSAPPERQPGVAFGGDGSAIIVWTSSADSRAIRAAHRAPGAALFGAPVPAVADNG